MALQLAAKYPLRLISVDSAQVYRGMDIGTGKPSAAVLARVPHDLVDIRDPAEAYSAAEFCVDVRQAIAQARAQGRLPLLVGGTMLYFKALRDGLAAMPPGDSQVRQEISDMAEAEGWEGVHARLMAVDPASAARIHPNDPQRLQRALEVYLLTGLPLSAFHKKEGRGGDGGDAPALNLQFYIVRPGASDDAAGTSDDAAGARADLHQRIAVRFRGMLAQGFVEEVRGLRARPDLHLQLPSMKSVGYRQIWQYLDGETSREEMQQRAIAATRQLAKRQLTWLRQWPGEALPMPSLAAAEAAGEETEEVPLPPALCRGIEGLLKAAAPPMSKP